MHAPADPLGAAVAIAALIAAAYGAWRKFRPSVRRASAALDAIVGKEAVIDRSGKVMESAQPGLVHRVATVEEAVVEFRHMVGLLTETQKRIAHMESRVQALEDSRVEKIVTAAERAATAATSAEMLRLVHERDTVDVEGLDVDELDT